MVFCNFTTKLITEFFTDFLLSTSTTMKKIFKICFVFSFLYPAILFAQKSDWVDDSIYFYQKKIEKAISAQEFQAIINYNKIIENEASKTLNSKAYDYFYAEAKRVAYKEQPEILARLNQAIGNLEYYRSNLDAAKAHFNKALILYSEADMGRSAAGMAMNLAILMEKRGEFDSAILNYKKTLPIFEQLQDTSTLSRVLENLALAHKQNGNYDSAIFYMGQVDSVLQLITAPDSERWITVYYNKGFIYQSMSVFDKSLDFIQQGIILSEKLENDRLLRSGYVNMIDLYHRLEDTTNIRKYIKLNRDFAEKADDKSSMAGADISLGILLLDQSNLDSALYYAENGLSLAREANSEDVVRRAYILLGNISYRRKDFKGAINNFEIVINQYPSSRRKSMSGIYHNLGSAYMELGNFQKSTDYLSKSLELALELNVWDRLVETYESLSTNSKKQGDYKQALVYYELYKQYEDSIFNETKSQQIAEVQTQYETEKKDQSIAALEQDKEIQTLQTSRQQSQIYLSLAGLLLVLIIAFIFYYRSRVKQKANKALSIKNTEIEEQNKEKEMLLKEIHHRVKNNLQIISSLLSMQTRTLSDSKTIDAMKESQSRVKTMALIHEKLYQYDNLARINMNEYMRQLSDFLSQTYKSEKDIVVVIESEEVTLDIDTAVPLGLITNELLSNALKYAFADMEQGQINIKLIKDISGAYVLTISDTGKGLAADMNIEKSKSLGLKLVRTLTRQINGNLSISSHPGATFSIAFSENELAA